jgi:hypothetical protein
LRILIQEQGKTKLSLRLPSGPLTLWLMLKMLPKKDFSLTKTQKQAILKEWKRLKKIHRSLIHIDIQAKDGTNVLVKL